MSPKTTTTKERLDQINEHLRTHPPSPSPSQDTPESVNSSSSWESAVKELELRQGLARAPVLDDPGYIRQKSAGKLWVRERVAAFSEGRFEEIGSCTGTIIYDPPDEQGVQTISKFVAANNVLGWAQLELPGNTKRRVMVLADDFSLRGGHADGGLWSKAMYAEQIALDMRTPMIRLLDGSSGGGSVKSYFDQGRTYVPPLVGFGAQVKLLATCPVASALLGPVVGLAALKTSVSHLSVMVSGTSQLFAAGPPIVSHATYENVTKDQLGGPAIHSINGSVDNIVSSEFDAFDQIKRFLSYLPSSSAMIPPVIPTDDKPERREEELLSIIPRRRNRGYDIRRLISLVVDRDSFFEIGRTWGGVLSLGSLGWTVDLWVYSAMTARWEVELCRRLLVESLDAMLIFGKVLLNFRHRLKIDAYQTLNSDTFGLPILNLVDQPGIAVGTAAEKEATVREATAALVAIYQATVPIFTIILRRVFGVAGGGQVDFASPANNRVAWPSGDWGSLPLAGGVEAAFKGVIETAKTEEERADIVRDLTNRLEAIRSPFRTAETFGVEEIIDPRATRPMACTWASHVYEHLLPPRLVKVIAQGTHAGGGRWRP